MSDTWCAKCGAAPVSTGHVCQTVDRDAQLNAAWESAIYNARRADNAEAEIDRLKAEVERLRGLCAEWVKFSDDITPSCSAGWDLLNGLRARTDKAGRG